MLLEVVDAREVCFSREGLLVRATVYGDEIGSCILESLAELYEEIMILPTKTSLDGYGDFDRLCHLFYDFECRISIDHE